MTVQDRNSEQINLLRGEFQGRYEPQFAAAGIAGRVSQFTGLRGFWPMSAVNSASDAIDQSGLGNDLTRNGNTVYGYDALVPYADFDGVTDYLSHADSGDFDIIGTEAYIETARRGLTIGGWFQFDAVSGLQFLMSKYDAGAANRSYSILTSGTTAQFRIYDAVNTLFLVSLTSAVTTSGWYFIRGTYVPSTSITIEVNGSSNVNTTTIPASLFNSSVIFTIGADGAGQNELTGRASNCFLCASNLSQSIRDNVYNQSKAAYGVE